MKIGKQSKAFLLKAKEIKNLLPKFKSSEFFVFIGFVVLATIFWFIKKMDGTYEDKVYIPIEIVNIPENMIITQTNLDSIELIVKDKGSALLQLKMLNKEDGIKIDFNKYKEKGNPVVFTEKDIILYLNKYIQTSTSILSMQPDTLSYFYCLGKAKKVPVVVNGSVQPDKKHYIYQNKISPDSVLVYAPANILKNIHSAETELIDIEKVDKSFSKELKLKQKRGAKFMPNSVLMECTADIYTEKILEVSIEAINFPKDKMLKTFPKYVNLTIRVGMKDYKNVKPEEFKIIADYNELKKTEGSTYPIKVNLKPNNVKIISIKPSSVDYLIEKKTK